MDPIEEEGGMNLYGFVENDGVSDGDYLGLEGAPKNLQVEDRQDPEHHGRHREHNPTHPHCSCYSVFLHYRDDVVGRSHVNVSPKIGGGSGGKTKVSLEEPLELDPRIQRGAEGGLLYVSIEKKDTAECKNLRCKYITVGIGEFAPKGVRFPPGNGIKQPNWTFKDGQTGAATYLDSHGHQLIDAIAPWHIEKYETLDDQGRVVRWSPGLFWFIESFDLKTHDIICSKVVTLIEP